MSEPAATAPAGTVAGPPATPSTGWRGLVIDTLRGGRWSLALPVVAAVVLLAFPLYSGSVYWLREIPLVAVLALVVSGVNLSFGYAGEVQFGQVFMFGLGAYLTMILATHGFNEILPLILIGGLAAAAVGAAIALPALRIGGWSLAMASFFLVVTSPDIANLLSHLTGGDNGLYGIPAPDLFGLSLGNRGLYLFSVIAALVWMGMYRNLVTSRHGVTFRMLRQSPVLAQSLGFSTLRLKLMAYCLGAFPAGMAGCLFGYLSLLITPDDFGLNLAIGVVAASVLGGVESVYGVVLGAAILQLGPESSLSFAQYAPIAYGGFLVVAAVLLRGGVGGLGTLAARRLALRLGGGGESVSAAGPTVATAAGDLAVAAVPALPGAPLAVAGVSKRFGGNQALDGVSLHAAPGQVTALIGANGSGKTTLLNAICGLVAADVGTIEFGPTPLSGQRPHRIAGHGVGRTFQTPTLPTGTTVLDVVASGRFSAHPAGLLASVLRLPSYRRARREDREQARAALRLVGLEALAEHDAASQPLGIRRLLEVARSMCGAPGLLLLDEPASGLSENEVERLGAVITAAARAGATVILIEHNFGFVARVSDVVHVLHLGALIASGSADEVARDPQVVASYLGTGGAGVDAEVEPELDPAALVGASPTSARPRRGPGDPRAAPVLRVADLKTGYGDLQVLWGVDLSVPDGHVEAVLGRNGVGKTTLLSAVSGQIPVWSGALELGGASVVGQPPYRRAAAGVALVQEGKRVFRRRTVAENVELGTHALSIGRAEREELCRVVLSQFPALEQRADERAGGLSGGQQQMLAIAQALAARPRILLLDEPSAGLAPAIVDDLFAQLRRLADDGLAIIVVEQLADRAMHIADHVTVLDGGRVIGAGAPGSFHDLEQLQEAYFGRA